MACAPGPVARGPAVPMAPAGEIHLSKQEGLPRFQFSSPRSFQPSVRGGAELHPPGGGSQRQGGRMNGRETVTRACERTSRRRKLRGASRSRGAELAFRSLLREELDLQRNCGWPGGGKAGQASKSPRGQKRLGPGRGPRLWDPLCAAGGSGSSRASGTLSVLREAQGHPEPLGPSPLQEAQGHPRER